MEPDKLLQKLPTKTPMWAVGVSVVLISSATALTSMYIVSRTEVVKIIDKKIALSEVETESQIKSWDKVLNTVLDLVNTNSKQITDLSKALYQAQDTNTQLSERVTKIEKELALARHIGADCEEKLKSCQEIKRRG